MKVKDQSAWEQQASELRVNEMGQLWLLFFEFWFDAAETMTEEVEVVNTDFGDEPFRKHSTRDAVIRALELTEKIHGVLAVEWIGQMLMVAEQYWIHGEQLAEGLTFIERRLVDQEIAKKLVDLQNSASMPVDESSSDS